MSLGSQGRVQGKCDLSFVVPRKVTAIKCRNPDRGPRGAAAGAAVRTEGHVSRALASWAGKDEVLLLVVAGCGAVAVLICGAIFVVVCQRVRSRFAVRVVRSLVIEGWCVGTFGSSVVRALLVCCAQARASKVQLTSLSSRP